MWRGLFKESILVLGWTLFFFTLAATVGIPGDRENETPAAAADEQFSEREESGMHRSPLRIYPFSEIEPVARVSDSQD